MVEMVVDAFMGSLACDTGAVLCYKTGSLEKLDLAFLGPFELDVRGNAAAKA